MTADNDPQVVFEERHFAEDTGLLFELIGGNRMAGRVWGLLTISEEPQLSAADLADRLGASAGSISTATRLLIGLGLLERVRVPGDRRGYFRIREGGMAGLVNQRRLVIAEGRRLAERGLREFGDRPRARERLEGWHSVYEFYERELPELARRYSEEQARRTGRGEEK